MLLLKKNVSFFLVKTHDLFLQIDPPRNDGRIDTDLPKQLPGTVYTMMYDDEGVPNVFNPSVKYMKFIISSKDGKKVRYFQ